MLTRVYALAVLLASGTATSTALAQQYTISTYAGGAPPLLRPVLGVNVSIGKASGIATDAAGNVYFASTELHAIFKLDQSGMLSRIAGSSPPGYSGDGGPATIARLQLRGVFSGLAVDRMGNLFFTDTGNNRIRKVTPDGIITTVAGGGVEGLGDGGLATAARLEFPAGVAVDANGNLFIADAAANLIRKVSATGMITTVAGNGTKGYSGDGGPATSSALDLPTAVAIDGAGNLFIADRGNDRVRRVSTSAMMTTVAGGGTLPGSSSDGKQATSARLEGPWGVSLDGIGNLIIADASRVRKVSANGVLTTIAGNGTEGVAGSLGDGGPATNARLFATGVAVDGAGNLLLTDFGNDRIRKVSTGIITTVAGNGMYIVSNGGRVRAGDNLFFSGDGGPAQDAQLNYPSGAALDSAGNLFIADQVNHRIRKVSPEGIVETVAGNGTCCNSGDGGPATSASLSAVGVAVDRAGNLFIGGYGRVRRVSPDGIINTVAGDGKCAFGGDGGPAFSALLCGVSAVSVDSEGNLLIADSVNHRVRKVTPDGIIRTVSGDGTCGFAGDGSSASRATLCGPTGLASDAEGNLFIAVRDRIRKVSKDGTIGTVAGGGMLLGSSADGGPATSAQLGAFAVAVDGMGNVYISDPGADFGDYPPTENRIRKVSSSGIVTTIAGNGAVEFSGDGGPAVAAALNGPIGLAVDTAGNIYIADSGNHVVRVLRIAPDPK